ICFSNYTIQPIYRPTDPSKPCLTCTKQWCLDQKLPICLNAGLGDQNPDTGTGKEGDVDTRCFQRDSPRDQMIVTLFLLTIIGLLIGAAVKTRLERIGFDSNRAWSSGRTWWEFFLPSRQADVPYSLGATSPSRSRTQYDRLPVAEGTVA
ncbi:uncharacterized protein EI90DRAFT_2913297, partial [Cantharellus anzutake]|uniref:uncharacterized protein n=1 Tax=Cantharellus anzutake TaxID=1750568 RepID=UPI0019036CE4